MKGFKLYFIENQTEVLLSEYFLGKKNNSLTYNERLDEEENDRYILSFSIAENTGEGNIPIKVSDYLRIGRVLVLELFGPRKRLKLVITSISPVGSSKNIIWNITAEDYPSVVWSKNNVGLNFNTFEDREYIDWIEEEELPGSARDIINFILERGSLQNEEEGWLTPESLFTDEQLESIKMEDREPLDKVVNIEISDSNTYNALVEVAILTDSLLKIEHGTDGGIVNLISKNSDDLKTNYWLSPDVNLSDLSLSYTSESLFPILYAIGGEDDYGASVGLIPFLGNETYSEISKFFEEEDPVILDQEYLKDLDLYDDIPSLQGEENKDTLDILNRVPYLDSFILNLEYFKENKLMSEDQYSEIFDKIYNDLRFINVDFQKNIYHKLTVEGSLRKIKQDIENTIELLVKKESDGYSELEGDSIRHFRQKSGREAPDITRNAKIDNNFKQPYDFKLNSNSINWIFTQINEDQYESFEDVDVCSDNWKIPIRECKTYWEEEEKYMISSSITHRLPLSINFKIEGQGSMNGWRELASPFEWDEDDYETGFFGDDEGASKRLINANSDSRAIYEPYTLRAIGVTDKIQRTLTVPEGGTILDAWGALYRDWRQWWEDPILPMIFRIDSGYGYDYIIAESNGKDRKFLEYEEYSSPQTEIIEYNNFKIENEREHTFTYRSFDGKINFNFSNKNRGTNPIRDMNITVEGYPNITTTWEYNELNIEFTIPKIDTRKNTYSYFDLLRSYAGIGEIESVIENYKNICLDYIEERDQISLELKESIKELEDGVFETEEEEEEKIILESTIANLKSNLSILHDAVGDDFNLIDGSVSEDSTSFGKYSLIYDFYLRYFSEYLDEIEADIEDLKEREKKGTILYKFNEINNKKKKFWFELKKEYGEFLWEGYYENEIEISSLNLYVEALQASNAYWKPSEEFGMSYIDLSQVLGDGVSVDLIQVGDIVSVAGEKLGMMENGKNIVQVSSISRDLRDFSDITLTVDNVKRKDSLIEKILMGLGR